MASKKVYDQARAKAYLSSALREMPEKFLACRDIRHMWKVSEKFRADNDGLITRACVCTRCGTERFETFAARSFDKIATQYRYPQHYQIEGNHLRGGAGALVRKEVFKRG